jgi:hypothetical protein
MRFLLRGNKGHDGHLIGAAIGDAENDHTFLAMCGCGPSRRRRS